MIKNNPTHKENSFKHIHHVEDKLLKQISNFDINMLLKKYGLEYEVIEQLNSEFTYVNIERRADFLALTNNNNVIDFEFQSTDIDNKDIERLGEYVFLSRQKYKKCTYLIVFTLPNISKTKSVYYYINPETAIKIDIYSLNENGDLIGKELNNKIKKGEKLTNEDIVNFILRPLMINTEKIENILLENINNLKKINVTKKEKEFIESMILLIINKFVNNNENREFLWRQINMKIDLLYEMYEPIKNEGINIGRQEGKEEGIKERNIEIAKNMKSKGLPIEEIATYTNLDINEIKKIH